MARRYRRVLIKLSGEFLFNFDGQAKASDYLLDIISQVNTLHKSGMQVAIVLGGGNICRGRSILDSGAKRLTADNVGMLGTVINSLVFRDILDSHGAKTKLYSAFPVGNMAAYFEPRQAIDDLERGYTVISSGGTGNPLVSTDTCAGLRAIQLEVDAVIKLTNVDGVYNKDPNIHADAKVYREISYEKVIADRLEVMDMEAFTHCKKFNIPIHIANYQVENVISELVSTNSKVGTLVSSRED